MVKKSNKMLLIFVAIAVVVAVPILLKSKGVKHEEMTAIPTVQNITGDTTADTLATVQAEVKKVEESNQDIVKFNENLTREREQNNADVDRIKKTQGKVDQNLRQLNAQTKQDRMKLEASQRELDDLKRQLAQMQAQNESRTSGGLPIGFGFEEGEVSPQAMSSGAWHKPLDAIEDEEGKSRFGLLKRSETKAEPPKTVIKKDDDDTVVKMLTVADNGTGLDGVALTAMVGRIPVKGSIPDPYPFKLIMGKENIMANGLDLPEVEGMIWSGIAKGDWNLLCVAGDLYSVTFIFQDGRIVTHEADDGEDPLGWVSDKNGFPCISGTFVTNAPQFLAQRTGLSALGVAAEAYAEAQRTTRSNLLGTESFVSGDTSKYVLGEAVGSATDEVSSWLLERQQQSFDAVVVLSGASVGIHITEELQIDYKLDGRKLRYEQNVLSSSNYLP